MKEYFVSAMFSAGWVVEAEDEEEAIEEFCKEAETYIDGDIEGNTIEVDKWSD
jgi:hypothetical protein